MLLLQYVDFKFLKICVEASFLRELVKENEGGRFNTTVGAHNRESGLAIKCSAELHSNINAFEGVSSNGTIVEK